MAKATDTLNLYQRIHAVMSDLDYIQKDPKKAGLQFSYASHDKVTAAVREVCVKHGLLCFPSVQSYNQDGNRTEVYLRTKFINIDNPQEWEEVFSVGFGVDPQDKGPGKGVSYAFKYALLKAFMLETGDDADAGQGPEFNHKKGATTAAGPATPPNTVAAPTKSEKEALFADLLTKAASLYNTDIESLKAQLREKGLNLSTGIEWLQKYLATAKAI